MRRLLLIPLFLVAGCGAQASTTGVASVSGGTTTPTASASPTTTADQQEQARKFAQCMRDNGVDMPDPDPNGGGGLKALIGKEIDKDKLKKAIDACRELSPIKDRGDLKPEQIEQMRKFAACMRDNGVDMPDPNPDGTMSSGNARNFKRDDPQFKKALDACQDKLAGAVGAKS